MSSAWCVAQALLGQPLWRPPSPQGFSDEEAAWLDGLPTRLDIASTIAARLWDRLDPHTMVDEALGPLWPRPRPASRSNAPRARRRLSRCC